MTRVLAVDIGTSSARAQLFDDGAKPIGPPLARLAYRADANGELPLEPIVSFAESALATAGPVDAVAWSSLWHSLVLLDERGRAQTPVSTWLDPRAAPDAAALAAELDGADVHARTGAPLHASFWPAKLRRLARVRARFSRVASLADYLRLRVDGELATSLSLASGTGLLDVHTLQWDRQLLDALELDEAVLPPICDDGVWLGDGAAANIGAGCTGACAAVTIGTSSALRVVRAEARSQPGLFLYRLDRRRYVQGGALSDGGNLLDWLSRLIGRPVGDALDRPPGDVTFLPHLGGERSPGWHAGARGVVSGLTHATNAADIAQAIFEGIGYRLAAILELVESDRSDRSSQTKLENDVDQVQELVGTGAALVSRPGWAQLLADVFGKPVTLSAVAEASARGAAVVALGLEDHPAPLGERFEPRPERTMQHREARARLDALYRATASA